MAMTLYLLRPRGCWRQHSGTTSIDISCPEASGSPVWKAEWLVDQIDLLPDLARLFLSYIVEGKALNNYGSQMWMKQGLLDDRFPGDKNKGGEQDLLMWNEHSYKTPTITHAHKIIDIFKRRSKAGGFELQFRSFKKESAVLNCTSN